MVSQQCLIAWDEGAGRDGEAVNPGSRQVANIAWSQNSLVMKCLSMSSDPIRCHLFQKKGPQQSSISPSLTLGRRELCGRQQQEQNEAGRLPQTQQGGQRETSSLGESRGNNPHQLEQGTRGQESLLGVPGTARLPAQLLSKIM